MDEEERNGFTLQIEAFLRDLEINRETHEFDEKSIMDMAETKEERQKILDTFFRVICVQVCKTCHCAFYNFVLIMALIISFRRTLLGTLLFKLLPLHQLVVVVDFNQQPIKEDRPFGKLHVNKDGGK